MVFVMNEHEWVAETPSKEEVVGAVRSLSVTTLKPVRLARICDALFPSTVTVAPGSAKGGHRVFIIGGEAKGPDTWAWDFVRARIKTAEITGAQCMWGMEQYRCDGIAYQIPSGNKFRWSKGGVKPLDRNLKLVEVASSMMKANEVKVLAIRDRRSGPPEKGGTMHTLRHAKEAGIRGQLIEV